LVAGSNPGFGRVLFFSADDIFEAAAFDSALAERFSRDLVIDQGVTVGVQTESETQARLA